MTLSRSSTLPRVPFVARMGFFAVLLASSACNAPASQQASPQPAASVAALAQPVVAPVAAAKPVAAAAAPSAVSNAAHTLTATLAPATLGSRHVLESSLKVKRFVVAAGVKDREPLVSGDALPSDGSAIYAFAELANPVGESENVRITFERKGGSERVGEVTLPIPASTLRHRTWAFTRFIRTPGVWEAVLWSENGTELSRTSFEVKAS
jgi:Protein of unknown function (DUF2914)